MSDHKTRKTKSAFRLQVKNLGPVVDADISFGDLTVIVGPQATGKSVLLETLKLVIDRDHVHETFSRYNVTFAGNGDGAKAFLGGSTVRAWLTPAARAWKSSGMERSNRSST